MKKGMLLCLLALPLRAQPEALRLSASFNELSALASRARVAALPFVHRTEALPENCANLPVVFFRNNEISKDGVVLGRNPSSAQANCDGMVAWQDNNGTLYRESKKIADNVSQYGVAWYGDVLIWKDNSGDLHKNAENFGRVNEFTFVKYTGDVVWKDGWGDLFRNREKFGRAQTFAAAARTGDVAWTDNFGILHRNAKELGRASYWEISARTGVVAWLDSFHALYKNDVKVGSDVNQFTLREDGKLIWVDTWGNAHSA